MVTRFTADTELKESMPMKSRFERTGARGLLIFEGALTVQNADTMRAALIKALIDANDVELYFENVTAVDVSCLALLCSAHLTALRLNKRLAICGSRPELFLHMMGAAGYGRRTGCPKDRDFSCLWIAR